MVRLEQKKARQANGIGKPGISTHSIFEALKFDKKSLRRWIQEYAQDYCSDEVVKAHLRNRKQITCSKHRLDFQNDNTRPSEQELSQ